MLRFVLAAFTLLLVEGGALLARTTFAPLRWEHLLVGGLAAMAALAVLGDARHRFGLGVAWLLAAPLVALGPPMGRWGLAVVGFWGLVYWVELRQRGKAPAAGALRCPRCRSAAAAVTSPPEAYCPDCGHTFETSP